MTFLTTTKRNAWPESGSTPRRITAWVHLLVAVAVASLLAALGGCSSAADDGDAVDEVSDSEAAAVAAEQADRTPELLVKDPKILTELEHRGYSFSKIVPPAAFADIAQAVKGDVKELTGDDPQAGIHGDDHRTFNAAWMDRESAPFVHFELVGVTNRIDRLATTPGHCGEVRFVYRMAYKTKVSHSRLPLTIMAVFLQKEVAGGCSAVAHMWKSAANGHVDADALLSGPLKARGRMDRVETNFQAVRWLAGTRPTLGGHVEYVLRVFDAKAKPGRLVPQPLENTPRTDLSPEERSDLLSFLLDPATLHAIDQGSFVLPKKYEKYLATRVVSVAPRGLARLANRPYKALFGEDAFSKVRFDGMQLVTSPAALVRRLDTMTCQGCHQSRSIAGFHFLGEERNPKERLNALAVGESPHLLEILEWRQKNLEAVAAGKAGTALPLPFADHAHNGGFASHCGLGHAGFEKWTCGDPSLKCLDIDGDDVGLCTPKENPPGDACETGRVSQSLDPHVDVLESTGRQKCSRGAVPNTVGEPPVCLPTSNGFAGGMCSQACDTFGDRRGNTICGFVVDQGKFGGPTDCLFKFHKPFQVCELDEQMPTMLRQCDRAHACRDEFVCARIRNAPPGVGGCTPVYSLFETRVDGHVIGN